LKKLTDKLDFFTDQNHFLTEKMILVSENVSFCNRKNFGRRGQTGADELTARQPPVLRTPGHVRRGGTWMRRRGLCVRPMLAT
jgi:hypothetical protein